MARTTNFVFVLCSVCVGCHEDPSLTKKTDVEEPSIAGRVAFDGPVRGALVEVFNINEDGRAEAVGSTFTGFEGEWSAAGEGEFWVGATKGGFRMSALVGEGATQTTPITSLANGYLVYLLGQGMSFEEASAKSKRLVFGHFGRIDHGRVWASFEEEWGVEKTDLVVAGAMLLAFIEQAKEMGVEPGVLVTRYHEDIESDGVFDGIGSSGEPLSCGETNLDGDSLRLRYSQAFRRVLERGGNLPIGEFEGLLSAIANNQSEIFPEGPIDGRDSTPPTVKKLRLVDGVGQEIDTESRSVRGQVFVELEAEDESGIESIEVSGSVVDAVGEDLDGEEANLRAAIHTTELQDGPSTIEFLITDTEQNSRRAELVFDVDNTAPSVAVEIQDETYTGDVEISGEWQDFGGTGVDVIVEVESQEQFRIENAPRVFEAVAVIPCNDRSVEVSVAVVDRAGWESAPVTEWVTCPDISGVPVVELMHSEVVQERDLELELEDRPEGTRVNYVVPQSHRKLEINESTVEQIDTTGTRVKITETIEKYFNRLDEYADNIPVIRFKATDNLDLVKASYRYLVDGVEKQSWEELPLNSRGEFEVELSYQSLGVDLIQGVQVRHRIEVKVENEIGREGVRGVEFRLEPLSPPIWIDECGENWDQTQYAGIRRLEWETIGAAFRNEPRMRLTRGRMRYLLSPSPGSMAPQSGAEVSAYAGAATVSLTGMVERKFSLVDWVNEAEASGYPGFQTAGAPYYGIPEQCCVGQAACETEVHVVDSSMGLSCGGAYFVPTQASSICNTFPCSSGFTDISPSQMNTEVFGTYTSGQESSFRNAAQIDAEEEVVVRVVALNPNVTVGGARYEWPETNVWYGSYSGWHYNVSSLQLPGGFEIPGTAGYRYWMPVIWFKRYGVDAERTVVVDPADGTCTVAWPRTTGFLPFETRVELTSFEVAVPRVEVLARNTVVGIEVPVRRAPECEGTVITYSRP